MTDSFYVDYRLTGADSVPQAIELRQQLQKLFSTGRYLLRKWKLNEPTALLHLPLCLVDHQPCQELPLAEQFMNMLGLEWST